MPAAKPNIIHGAFLAIAMRWTDRLIGLLSTIILARILVPADFGIIATASIVIALADVLLEMGVWLVLMQTKNPTPAHYDTAWTIRFVQTSIMTALVLLAAPYAAGYFDNPELTPVIRVLALTFVLEGLENIWIINLQKEQQYTRDFNFMFSKRFTGFVVTVACAVLYESYWALVAGNLVGRLTGVILSYVMHPNRPRFSLEKFREIFTLSQWVWVQSIAQYFQLRLHEIVVASRESSSVMGTYTLAGQIAAMPTSELLAPLNRVLFPAFVKVKSDLNELKRVFLLAQSVQALVAIPAGVGMALVAHEIVTLMLGEKWLPAVPLVETLALIGCFTAITSSGIYVLSTLGKFRITAMYAWIQVAIFATLAYLAFPDAGAAMVAQLRVVLAILGLISFTLFLCRELPGLKVREMAASVVRPALGASAMYCAITALAPYLNVVLVLQLIIKIFIGALVYSLTVFGIWALLGRKAGAESYVLDKLIRPLLKKL
ncbi:lipopolysaccharide biosynthesis protein [Thauera sp. SDU_THAU2]|uniref:lipopolysaccharide biosynthesis protein n=1 Tax=Thauera sp. SDU_THAU2 TaxID=3136633 RepID=UPI00311E4174